MDLIIEPDQESFRRVVIAMSLEADGAALSRDLRRNLKAVIEPAAEQARSNLNALTSGGIPVEGESLRQAVAAGVQVKVSLSKRSPTVGLKAKKTPGTRGFRNAPKRLNAESFRHPVFGNKEIWVMQRGAPGWFDKATDGHRSEYISEVFKALKAVADRIARKA